MYFSKLDKLLEKVQAITCNLTVLLPNFRNNSMAIFSERPIDQMIDLVQKISFVGTMKGSNILETRNF